MRFLVLVFGMLVFCASLVAQENSPLLDSVLTTYFNEQDSSLVFKRENQYDQWGNQASHSVYYQDPNQKKWIGTYFPCEECIPMYGRYEYQYDYQGNLIWQGGLYWSESSHEWVLSGQSVREYDDQKRIISYTHSQNTANGWVSSLKLEYEYPDTSQITIRYYKEAHQQDWTPAARTIQQFENGKQILEINQSYDTNDWWNVDKTETVYSDEGVYEQRTYSRYSWDGSKYIWEIRDFRWTELSYDENGNCILFQEMARVGTNGSRVVYQLEMEYNEAGQKTQEIRRNGDSTASVAAQKSWEYNEAGDLLSETACGLMQRFEDGLAIPENFKVIRFYNSEGLRTHEDWYYWQLGDSGYQDGEYVFNSRDRYYYHSISTGVNDAKVDPIILYPNPASEYIHISGINPDGIIEILTLSGRLVKSIETAASNINISTLPPGIYLLRIRDPENTQTVRIIKN